MPTSLVVKKGSKILGSTSGGMPCPLSSISIITKSPGGHRRLAELLRLVGADVAGPHDDPAALRHGVAGVDHEVDDDLLQLVEVGLDQPQVAAVAHVDLDLLADQATHHVLQFGEHVGELQHLGPQRLAAREGEQLPHQAGGPVGVLLDLHDVLERRIGRPVVREQQVGIAEDGGQHVVEVVRDAARELADGLHLLRLGEALLQRALLGGVEHEEMRARAPRRSPPRPETKKRAARLPGPFRLASTGATSVWPAIAAAIAACSAARSRSTTPAKMERAGPVLAAQPLAEELGEGRVGADHRAGRVDGGDRHRGRVEQAGEAHLGGPQVIRRLLAGARG